ncbi:MAG: Prephenate dehydrogenase, partial [Dehalococcoidia bacterium]|nr:Prephenate dehydrogenase [Dehalococcoidia bacterium]
SRLASTDPKMSLGITLTNRLNLIRWLDGCVDVLREYRDTLANGGDGILEEMERVWEAREQWVNNAVEPYKDKALEDVPNATDAMGEFVVGKWALDRLRKMDEIAEKGLPRKDTEERGS